MSEEIVNERRQGDNDNDNWLAISRMRLLSEALSPQLQRFVVRCALRCECDGAAMALLRDDVVIVRAAYKLDVGRVGRQESALAFAADSESVMVVGDASQHAELAHCAEVTGEPHIRFMASVPFSLDGHGALGTLTVFSGQPRPDPETFSSPLLEAFRGVLQQLLLQRDNEEFDKDTGLLGPQAFGKAFAEQYRSAQRGQHELVLLILSLPNLGRLNRKHGVSAGDRVVATLTELVHRRLMIEDVRIGRLSGSSVAVLLPRRLSNDFLAAAVAAVRQGLVLARQRVPLAALAFDLAPGMLPENLDLELLLVAAERATAGREAARMDPLPRFEVGQLREFAGVQQSASEETAEQDSDAKPTAKDASDPTDAPDTPPDAEDYDLSADVDDAAPPQDSS